MKVFNSKLAAIGLAAFVFASCSDNTSDPTGGSSPAKVDATTLDLTNSGESLFSSVINYKNTTLMPVSSLVQEQPMTQIS